MRKSRSCPAEQPGLVERAREHERPLVHREALVGERVEIDGNAERVALADLLELLARPGPPGADGVGDELAGRLVDELALVHHRCIEAARHLTLFEPVDEVLLETHEEQQLLERIGAEPLGTGEEVFEQLHVGRDEIPTVQSATSERRRHGP